MGQLGTKLKQARLEQGLSLEQLNERTKIQKHHLEGIETGDYSAIPGGFYACIYQALCTGGRHGRRCPVKGA
ncbi:helix-turn-helix domain-containing protein [Planococcus sp. MB-3u-03]|uniref:helix-turn-helix domain-containing protein n=1 Tax=Planococcus sp. MB-3u-03 TaxID=2058136 RepID=UPI0012FED36A|nr:helix-turn-helix domain-containing protein [Planococcus sp. MB-3u-03]